MGENEHETYPDYYHDIPAVRVVRRHLPSGAAAQPGREQEDPLVPDLPGSSMNEEMSLPNEREFAGDTGPRCAPCGFSHEKCIGQKASERLVHLLGTAILAGNYEALDHAADAYEASL